MRFGHSVWAKVRQANDIINIQGLLKQYWDSTADEFTLPSQSQPPTSSSISDQSTAAVSFGKYDGTLELRFFANTAVRISATAHPNQLMRLNRPDRSARRSINSRSH